jgi:hypothetical protein
LKIILYNSVLEDYVQNKTCTFTTPVSSSLSSISTLRPALVKVGRQKQNIGVNEILKSKKALIEIRISGGILTVFAH